MDSTSNEDAELEKIEDMTSKEACAALLKACEKTFVAMQESDHARSEYKKAASHFEAIRENHSRTVAFCTSKELEEAIAKSDAAMRALCDVDRAAVKLDRASVKLRRFIEARSKVLEKRPMTDCEGQGDSSSN